MDNIIIGSYRIPRIEDNNSADYTVNSKIQFTTDINYFPDGLIEFEQLTNHVENKELKEIVIFNP
jgi:hypothetical protein